MRIALAVGVAVVAAVGAPVAGSHALQPYVTAAAAGFDYGDAPDGAPARYAEKPDVRGAFPSRAASGGPRHPSSGPHIGTRWTGDPDSRQVDADTDDGAQLSPRSCAVSTLSIAIDATDADATTPMYVNAWFDWNQDGDWADGGTRACGPEWGIQNVRIDPATLGEGRIGLVTLRFRAGKVPGQFWWRVQVHQGTTPSPHLGGGGQALPTSGGETEDSLYDRLPRTSLGLVCSPAQGIFGHGGTHDVDFSLTGTATALAVIRVREMARGDVDGIVIARRGLPGARTWRVRVRSTKRHERAVPVQSLRVELEVDAIVNTRPRTFRGSCGVAVAHTRRVIPPYEPPKKLTPAVTVPTAKVVVNPDRADPATAGCRARFVATGFSAGAVGASGGAVEVRCDGVDVKSMSVSAGSADQRIKFFRSDGGCETPLARRALRCTFRGPNKGRVVRLAYGTTQPFASTRLHVLAGGFGSGGTTIVLLQDFFFPREGMICRQAVPSAAACATL